MIAPTDQLALLPEAPPLTRESALARLSTLVGADLVPLADELGVTVWREGRRNKGWAGQTVERYLGQRPNSEQAPDFGDWELKVVPLTVSEDGRVRLKETMSITMFTADDLERQPFERSHLFEKLNRLIVVARSFMGSSEACSFVMAARAFDLDDAVLADEIREDYEEVRWLFREQGPGALSGRLGRWVQPRPKGAGYLAGGYGFYARKALVARILDMEALLAVDGPGTHPSSGM